MNPHLPYHFQAPVGFQLQQFPGVQPTAATVRELTQQDAALTVRQQPKVGLVVTEGKEKNRKPIDPPPIVQLEVTRLADPSQHYLQSPYLFMTVRLVPAKDEDMSRMDELPYAKNDLLLGSLTSSLHRLKDLNPTEPEKAAKDAAFFVFPDLSCRLVGTHRLQFDLYEYRKDTSEVVHIQRTRSNPFTVKLPKDFVGLSESTLLSRAFSDQGVKLRLRKEPRALQGKRAIAGTLFDPQQLPHPLHSSHQRQSSGSHPHAQHNAQQYVQEEEAQEHPNKRSRVEGNYQPQRDQAVVSRHTPYQFGGSHQGYQQYNPQHNNQLPSATGYSTQPQHQTNPYYQSPNQTTQHYAQPQQQHSLYSTTDTFAQMPQADFNFRAPQQLSTSSYPPPTQHQAYQPFSTNTQSRVQLPAPQLSRLNQGYGAQTQMQHPDFTAFSHVSQAPQYSYDAAAGNVGSSL